MKGKFQDTRKLLAKPLSRYSHKVLFTSEWLKNFEVSSESQNVSHSSRRRAMFDLAKVQDLARRWIQVNVGLIDNNIVAQSRP